jgi:uncharacterized membrane protein
MHLLATSVQEPDTVSFYNLVLFVHILAAIVAFGVTFAFPLIDAALHRPANRHHLAWWRTMQVEIERKLIGAAATVLLLAGIYLAAAGPFDFGSTSVSAGIVIMGVGGAVLTPAERKAAELAKRDIVAASGGEVTLSPEYEAVARRLRIAGGAASALVVIALFLMVMKPA